MTFWNTSGYRTILDTETDSSSPVSEELMSQIRENIEALYRLNFLAETSGTASKNPSSGTTGLFYDTAKTWTTGQHNYKTLLVLSGNAKGNKYPIKRTLPGSSAISSSGNNLYADGIRSGDRYIITYSLDSTMGHNHDDINSRAVVQKTGLTMLPFSAPEESTELSSSGNGVWTGVRTYQVFIPNQPSRIHLYARLCTPNDGYGNYPVTCRLNIDGKTGSTITVSGSCEYAGYVDCKTPLDPSTMTPGMHPLTIQLITGQNAQRGKLQGYSMYWGEAT